MEQSIAWSKLNSKRNRLNEKTAYLIGICTIFSNHFTAGRRRFSEYCQDSLSGFFLGFLLHLNWLLLALSQQPWEIARE